MDKYMNVALDEVKEYLNKGLGGPFGACIIDSTGKIIAVAHNEVIKKNDPTAHAEIEAIRMASQALNNYNLKGCTLYTTCMPCPMCLSAIIWANINKVYYGCTSIDADNLGFKDAKIYDYINGKNKDILELNSLDHDECLEIFNKYNNKIY